MISPILNFRSSLVTMSFFLLLYLWTKGIHSTYVYNSCQGISVDVMAGPRADSWEEAALLVHLWVPCDEPHPFSWFPYAHDKEHLLGCCAGNVTSSHQTHVSSHRCVGWNQSRLLGNSSLMFILKARLCSTVPSSLALILQQSRAPTQRLLRWGHRAGHISKYSEVMELRTIQTAVFFFKNQLLYDYRGQDY